MTIRAIILGFIGVILICGLTYINDAVMHQTFMVGNFLPCSIFGAFLFLVLIVNPLLNRLRAGWALSGMELVVCLSMTLVAACIPGSGLLRTFTSSLVLPSLYQNTVTSWKGDGLANLHTYTKPGMSPKEVADANVQVVHKVPPYMLADVNAKNENTVLNGFIQGLSKGNTWTSVQAIPWSAWAGTLWFWIPLILIVWVGLLGLSMVVHKQWSEHELLPYPIITFVTSLLPDGKRIISETLRNRLFWLGMVAVLVVHLDNYGCVWFPNMIPIKHNLDLASLLQPLQLLMKGTGWSFFWPTYYFSVIAFAFFLPTDVSLAMAAGPLIFYIVNGTLISYGIQMGGPYSNDPTPTQFVLFGAYFGFLLVLLYNGRAYYRAVLLQAFGVPAKGADRLQPSIVWGARIFFLAMLLFVIYVQALCQLEWQMALLFVGCLVLIFLVMSRIIAETGLFFIQPGFYPFAILVGLFGPAAVGLQNMLLVLMLTSVLLVDPREAFMPFVTNAFKMLEVRQIQPGKMAGWLVAAVVLGLAIAIPTTLYIQYNRGANMTDGWASDSVPKMAFNGLILKMDQLSAQGRLPEAAQISGFAHFTHMSPDPKAMIALVIGMALIILCMVGRLRFPSWPIHPVAFLIAGTYPGTCFFPSFTVGWLLKMLVVKFGGGHWYRQLIPLMVGVIAGDMAGGLITTLIGAIYYLVTGHPPKGFGIMPG